jgi:predicted DNA-binding transcriptional regulator AlpA
MEPRRFTSERGKEESIAMGRMRGFIIVDKHGNQIDLADPRPRRDIVNELMITKEEAAERCGITTKQFDALVKEGVFPLPAKASRRWDRKKLYECLEDRKLRTHKVAPGWVYFMEMGDFIKIGWSTWPASRREALQAGNPYDIKLLGAFPGCLGNEAAVHETFAHLRSRSEWFRKSPGLLAYIAWLKVAWRGHADMIKGDLDNVVSLAPRGENTGTAP